MEKMGDSRYARCRHILIEEKGSEAQARLEALKADIAGDADKFSEVAKEISTCTSAVRKSADRRRLDEEPWSKNAEEIEGSLGLLVSMPTVQRRFLVVFRSFAEKTPSRGITWFPTLWK